MTALLASANTLCYTDRFNMPVTVLEFGYSLTLEGYVLSAFFFGYMLSQVFSGYWANRSGAKVIMMVGMCIWTLADLSSIWTTSIPGLLIVMRVVMGMGEGTNHPCVHHLAARWFPAKERSTLVTIVLSGSDVGLILSLLTAPKIIQSMGWRFVFVIFAAVNVVWLVVFGFLASDLPEDSNQSDSKKIPEKEVVRDIPYKSLLTSRSTIAIFVVHFCYDYCWSVLHGWIPTFYVFKLGYNIKAHSAIAALPYILGAFSANVSGRISDKLVQRGYSITFTRKLMTSIATFAPAIILLIIPFVDAVPVAIALLCVCVFLARFAASGFYANMIDLSPRYAGQIMSISNTMATIPGVVGNTVTGWILSSSGGSWIAVFLIAGIVNVIGGVVFLAMATGEPQKFGAGSDDEYNGIVSLTDLSQSLIKDPPASAKQ
jgi:ACS family sodium-dependent inorganic phosphate cotransporter